MKLQVYHCSLAIFSDRRISTKPEGVQYYVDPDSGPNIEFWPIVKSSSLDSKAIELLRNFQEIDLHHLHESPLRLNWGYISRRLGLAEGEAKALLDRLYESGTLRRLTIAYDFEVWAEAMDSKGCLVLMACIEKKDYSDTSRILEKVVLEVKAIKSALVGMKFDLRDVILVPNAHLAKDEELGPDHKTNWALMNQLKTKLVTEGFTTKLASYGCAKFVHLVIHGHPLGYIFRHF